MSDLWIVLIPPVVSPVDITAVILWSYFFRSAGKRWHEYIKYCSQGYIERCRFILSGVPKKKK